MRVKFGQRPQSSHNEGSAGKTRSGEAAQGRKGRHDQCDCTDSGEQIADEENQKVEDNNRTESHRVQTEPQVKQAATRLFRLEQLTLTVSMRQASAPTWELPLDVRVRADNPAGSTFDAVVVGDHVFHFFIAFLPLVNISRAKNHTRLWRPIDSCTLFTNILFVDEQVGPFIKFVFCQVQLLFN